MKAHTGGMVRIGENRWADAAHAARLGLKVYAPLASKALTTTPAARSAPVARPSAPAEPTPAQVKQIRRKLLDEIWGRFREYHCPTRTDVFSQILGDE